MGRRQATQRRSAIDLAIDPEEPDGYRLRRALACLRSVPCPYKRICAAAWLIWGSDSQELPLERVRVARIVPEP